MTSTNKLICPKCQIIGETTKHLEHNKDICCKYCPNISKFTHLTKHHICDICGKNHSNMEHNIFKKELNPNAPAFIPYNIKKTII